MNKLYKSGYIPEEQCSQHQSTAEDGKMDYRLNCDILRQIHQPLGAVSTDASNCYDRINHILMSLLLLAITGWHGAIATFLLLIQTMHFFPWTGLGDSDTFMGGPEVLQLLQGLCQGSGAAPACWLMLCSVLMHCYKRRGHGALFSTPILSCKQHCIGTVFVNNADLYTFAGNLSTSKDVFQDLQESTYTWCSVLNSTGGTTKPEKCSWWLIDY